ncbi:HTH-type transcriptional regulator MurR [Paraburkholderia kirstenboschensis]|uniref:MurR/RpiR family transcriptional regulator n=1 Tax=Paraburkholderia kirstenboschensis TaxID=1245436 RepID=UPI000AC3EEB1|nr:MurR/RpiR family transcriptional regulator [Paraburkholderia kirstenboschensis]CAD6553845.1 HTH-type transcriptional regulator MurR [Paraburkholderia kirstenboschensis]
MPTFNELVATIRDRFPDLSPQFQAGAAFLLDNPDEVAVLSMRKVAERAKVQPAAMVRLSQLLGFPGWSELREIFVSRVRTRPEPLTTRARSMVKGGSDSRLSRDLAQAQSHNLEITLTQNADSVVETAKTLKKAPHVHVAGFRSCYPVAFGLLYGYRLFRPSVNLLSGEAGTLEMQLRGIEKKHAVVVVSFAPYSVEAVRVAQAAIERGAKLIALTDSAVSPIALNADHTLIFSHESPSFFPSLVAASALAEMLVAHLLALEGKDAITNLGQAEVELHSQGAYAAS